MIEFWPKRVKRRRLPNSHSEFRITAIIKDESSNTLFRIKNEPCFRGKKKLDIFMREKFG